MTRAVCLLWVVLLFGACRAPTTWRPTLADYFAPEPTAVRTRGVRVVEIETAKGPHRIWTKRVGQHPRIKVLLLQGGPGCSHEYWECLESFLPAEGIEFIYYDQLDTGFSDHPGDPDLWEVARYVDEVEQVRRALGLTSENFFLLGHSWGGILAMEYALRHGTNLKGLIISNMMASCPAYDRYADEVLAPQLPPAVLAEIRRLEAAGDFANPHYEELLMTHFYAAHVCRLPLDRWPEPMTRSFGGLNRNLYVTMQGPSEFGIAGRLTRWDVTGQLPQIKTPTLTIGATHDTMDPVHMRWMARTVPHGRFLLCPNGSHMCMWDDQETYVRGLIRFLRDVDEGRFPGTGPRPERGL